MRRLDLGRRRVGARVRRKLRRIRGLGRHLVLVRDGALGEPETRRVRLLYVLLGVLEPEVADLRGAFLVQVDAVRAKVAVNDLLALEVRQPVRGADRHGGDIVRAHPPAFLVAHTVTHAPAAAVFQNHDALLRHGALDHPQVRVVQRRQLLHLFRHRRRHLLRHAHCGAAREHRVHRHRLARQQTHRRRARLGTRRHGGVAGRLHLQLVRHQDRAHVLLAREALRLDVRLERGNLNLHQPHVRLPVGHDGVRQVIPAAVKQLAPQPGLEENRANREERKRRGEDEARDRARHEPHVSHADGVVFVLRAGRTDRRRRVGRVGRVRRRRRGRRIDHFGEREHVRRAGDTIGAVRADGETVAVNGERRTELALVRVVPRGHEPRDHHPGEGCGPGVATVRLLKQVHRAVVYVVHAGGGIRGHVHVPRRVLVLKGRADSDGLVPDADGVPEVVAAEENLGVERFRQIPIPVDVPYEVTREHVRMASLVVRPG